MKTRISADTIHKTTKDSRGMVVAATPDASRAGAAMLARGGNAFDAAAAAALCVGVTEPQASGLGGQTSALLKIASEDRFVALDGSSRAPFGLTPERLPKKAWRVGVRATTVPSTLAVLAYLQERYGKLSFAEILEPAITAANEGFAVSALLRRLVRREEAHLRTDPDALALFFPDHRPIRKGARLVQPQLARTLRRLADRGWRDFYEGEIAAAIVEDMEERGGLISSTDLARIPTPLERPVLKGTYRRRRLVTFPPPGAGRALVEVINILEDFAPEEVDPRTPEGLAVIAQAFRAALKDRELRTVDPSLFKQQRRKQMLDKEYARSVARRIRRLAAVPEPAVPSAPPAAGETTHVSVADSEGNLVALTQSIELVFGARRMAAGLGFFYNNYMSAFDYADVMHPYYLLPGAHPWSSIAPTFLYRGGQPSYVLGSPGSDRIATTLVQVVLRLIDTGASLADAIAAPRIHATPEGAAHIERGRHAEGSEEALISAGFKVHRKEPYAFYLGCVHAVRCPRKSGGDFLGVADPRRDGAPAGPTNEEQS